MSAPPDYLVIGAMKCGTSSVCSYLEEHPEVFMLPNSEPSFFSNDEVFAKGTDWYESLFAPDPAMMAVGEGSNNYASGARFPHSAERIAAYRPGMKLIYIVRNPLDRLISAWIQVRADSGDRVPSDLNRLLQEQTALFLDQSLYMRNLSLYQPHFPPGQIFVGFMEDLKADPDAFFRQLTGFLGVAPYAQAARIHANPSSGKRVLSARYSRLRALPLVAATARTLPRPLRRFVKRRYLSEEITQRPRFSPQVHKRLVEILRADADPFLEAHGKPADFWKYDQDHDLGS